MSRRLPFLTKFIAAIIPRVARLREPASAPDIPATVAAQVKAELAVVPIVAASLEPLIMI